MRDLRYILKQGYDASRALIVGINQYKKASPLEYAVNDAEELKKVLVDDLGFETRYITTLINRQATKRNILKAFLSFTSDEIKVDDRLLIFFAGHGHTKSGIRGEVGYLIPFDADLDDCSTFIRWDELTRNSELIRAKHILFVMDACYGGLAVNRTPQSGSSRFLKDMYQRFSRQVITAGKADEVVSDAGGPLPKHSVFTGHLIEGLRGKAANEFGVITASGLMAYVYTKVANDINSDQTPHYGQFDGDGDFIIYVPNLDNSDKNEKVDIDDLITMPYTEIAKGIDTLNEKIDFVKELLSSEKSQIKLHDFAISEVKKFLAATTEDNFRVNDQYSAEKFLDRIANYETHTQDIASIAAMLGYWAKESDLGILSKIISRASDRLVETSSGLNIWIHLRWYPLLLILYHAGVAAVENRNYKSLAKIFYTTLGESESRPGAWTFAQKISNEMSELLRANVFKQIPGHENFFTPISEYLFKQIQPALDNLFFLWQSYEKAFDEFEILFALAVADIRTQSNERLWAPFGRFGWKHDRGNSSPYLKILNEASKQKNNWAPIQAGMFGGSYERFENVANQYKALLSGLNWF